MVKIKTICHGGAWSIPDEAKEKSVEGIRRAAAAGKEILKTGGKSEDAVVAAVSGLFYFMSDRFNQFKRWKMIQFLMLGTELL